MKILVTGGAGFIGSHLVDALVEQGHEVVVVDNFSTGCQKNLNPRAKFAKFDIRNSNLEEVFALENFEAVFHLAAQMDVQKSLKDPQFDARVNILGSLNLLDNCVKYKIKKVFFSSSCGVYGEVDESLLPIREDYALQPLSPYGIAKLTVEHYLDFYQRMSGLETVVLRYANVYGPRQSYEGEGGVVAIFISKMLAGKQSIINGDGQQTRDFVYVADVVRANLAALENNVSGTFNVGTNQEITINQLFNKLKKLTGSPFTAKYGSAIAGEIMKSCLDYNQIKQVLNWKPEIALAEGLKKTVKWFCEV